MEPSEVVTLIRKEKGLSQTDFAKLIGLTQAAISNIEAGKKQPHRSTIEKICRATAFPEIWFDLLTADESNMEGAARERFELVGRNIKDLIIQSLKIA